MRERFPDIQLIQNAENYGYAKGYTLALSQLNAHYFILLNSDVEVSEGWIDPVLNLMDADQQIAACQPKILDHKNNHLFEYAGAAGGFIDRYGYPFCRGRLFNAIETDEGQFNDAREVFWATGACLFVRPAPFRQVGGLDDAYFAHMEEIDLCWRLKNVGYKVFVQPASVIYHIGGGTLNKYSRQKTYLNFRNNLTTLTKNHHPRLLVLKIFFRLLLDGVAAFKFLFDGQPKHFFAVIHAHFSYYKRLPHILKQRAELKTLKGFSYNVSCMYKGNVVVEYFLRHKKKFSQLHKGYF
jgi:GT2 family glycosyltransferase